MMSDAIQNHGCGFLAAAIILVASSFAHAADWQIVQTAQLSSTTVTLSQTSPNSSHQAVNAIMLEGTADSIINPSSQTATFSGNDFSLTQSGTTQNNVQAINFASANVITGLSQSVTGFGTATLTQSMTSGTGNVQAINYALSTTTMQDVQQSVSGEGVTLDNSAAIAAGSSQMINYLNADRYSGDVSQTVILDVLDYSNNAVITAAGDSGINVIVGDFSGANVTQTATIGGVLTVNADNSALPKSVIINRVVIP